MIYYFLLLLLIPVIIHFFNFRKSVKVFFSNIATLDKLLIKDGYKSKLYHFFIFLARTLVFLFIILAIIFSYSKPMQYSSVDPKQIIFIDESLPFSVIVNSPKKGQVLDFLQDIGSISHLNLYNSISKSNYLELNSDQLGLFQKSVLEIEDLMKERKMFDGDFGNEISLIASSYQIDELVREFPENNINIYDLNQGLINVSIDSVFLSSESIGNETELNICFNSNTLSSTEYSYRVVIDNRQIGNGVVSFSQNKVSCVKLSLSGIDGSRLGKIEVNDDDLIFDNDFYFVLNGPMKKKVLLIDNPCNTSFPPLLFNKSLFEVSVISPMQFASRDITEFDALIVNGADNLDPLTLREIENEISTGRLIVSIPCKGDFPDPGYFVPKRLVKKFEGEVFEMPDFGNPLFTGVFNLNDKNFEMPFAISKSDLSSGYRPILRTKSGRILLGQSSTFSNAYFFSFPFHKDFTDFHESSLILPIFYRLILQNNDVNSAISYSRLGSEKYSFPFLKSDKEEVVSIEFEGVSIVPDQRWDFEGLKYRLENDFKQTGHFMIKSNLRDEIGASAMNLPNYNSLGYFSEVDKTEIAEFNNVRLFNESDLNGFYQQISKESTQSLWKYCLILALTFLLLEVLLLRRLK